MNHKELALLCRDSYLGETYHVDDCELSLSRTDDLQVVVIRGTDELADVVTDLRAIPWYDSQCGWCHSGFLKQGRRIAKFLEDKIDRYTPTVFTGHSMGGALSLICAVKMNHSHYLVSEWVGFASPKVQLFGGDKCLFRKLNYKNGNDPIPNFYHFYNHNYEVVHINKKDSIIPDVGDHAIKEYVNGLLNLGK